MTTRNSKAESVTISATVAPEEDGYVATVEDLGLVGKGATLEEAQDDLVTKFTAWIQTCEGKGTLEAALSEAGHTGVDEDTELELEFAE